MKRPVGFQYLIGDEMKSIVFAILTILSFGPMASASQTNTTNKWFLQCVNEDGGRLQVVLDTNGYNNGSLLLARPDRQTIRTAVKRASTIPGLWRLAGANGKHDLYLFPQILGKNFTAWDPKYEMFVVTYLPFHEKPYDDAVTFDLMNCSARTR